MTPTRSTQRIRQDIHVKEVHGRIIDGRFDTAAGISRQISSNLDNEVSRHTVSQRLSQVGLISRSPAIKNLSSKAHKVDRFVYAGDIMWTDDDLSKVQFRDESKFYLVGSDGQRYVRRRTKEKLLSKCVKKSV